VLQASCLQQLSCVENKLAERLTSLKQPGQIQKGYSQSKPIIKSADSEENVTKTSAKSQDESKDTSKNHMLPDHNQVNPEHQDLPEGSGSV